MEVEYEVVATLDDVYAYALHQAILEEIAAHARVEAIAAKAGLNPSLNYKMDWTACTASLPKKTEAERVAEQFPIMPLPPLDERIKGTKLYAMEQEGSDCQIEQPA